MASRSFVTEMYYRDPSGKLLMVVVGGRTGSSQIVWPWYYAKKFVFIFKYHANLKTVFRFRLNCQVSVISVQFQEFSSFPFQCPVFYY